MIRAILIRGNNSHLTVLPQSVIAVELTWSGASLLNYQYSGKDGMKITRDQVIQI